MIKFILFFLFSINIFAISNIKLLNKEIIPKFKYSVDYEISLENGVFPTKSEMEKIALDEKKNNPNFENYFINFYLPHMELNNGSYAACNFTNHPDDTIKATIFYETLLYNSYYSKKVKTDSSGNFFLENFENIKMNKKNIKIKSLNEIGANIILDYSITEDGFLYFKGYSNLPENMELILELENKKLKYLAQSSITISKDGSFEAGPFSDKDFGLKHGNYTISITSSYNFFQPSEVVSIIGKNGEKLKSSITKCEKNDFSDKEDTTINFTKKIKI